MDAKVIAVIIAGGTGIVSSLATVYWLKPLIDRRFHVFRLEEDYKHEQAKKIKETVGLHKSHLVKCAELLHSRLKNYSRNHAKGWLDISGDYSRNHYYMDSTIYRFLSFLAHIKILEDKLEYLDTVNSDAKDMEMLKYFRIFMDVMTDVQLFNGVSYDSNRQKDHFFRNKFEQYVEGVIRDGKVISFDQFEDSKNNILKGIKPQEGRLRLERVKAFHFILISFLNHFGYDFQTTKSSKVIELKGMTGKFKFKDGTMEIITKYRLKGSRSEVESIIKAYS
jgi:hypothetical protein